MAIEKDVKELDDEVKEPKRAKAEPQLAQEEPEHFADCVNCHGTGLDGEVLCAVCAGSGKALPSA